MKDRINVKNRSSGRVVYNIKEDGLRREFYPKEEKKNIPIAELQKLVQMPGGRELFYNYLQVDDPEVAKYLINAEIAPEYWITDEEMLQWIQTCSLPAFQDALDFAPDGVKDLIKKYAVSLKLNDYDKRQAIKEQLGFDVTAAIENSGEESGTATTSTTTTQRRTKPENSVPTPSRRSIVEE